MPTLFFVLTFAAVSMLAYGVLDMVFSEDRAVSRRLKGLSDYEKAQVLEAEPLLKDFGERVIRPALAFLGRRVKALWPARYMDRLRDRIQRAGHPRGMDVERFLMAKGVLALGTLGLLGVMSVLAQARLATAAFLVVTSTALAFYAPDAWLNGELARRKERIIQQLPDMLDMLTISVQAGLGFDAALAKVVKSSGGPLAQEFGRVLQEVQAGATRRDALRGFAERVDIPQVHAFVASIVQADVFGASVASVLKTQASELRLVRKQRAEEIAQKAPVKMVFPLVMCVLPATMIVILGPALIRIASVFGM